MTASHDNHKHKSILGDVAQHEKQLLAQLEAAKDEARRSVEKARADAQRQISDEGARIQTEVAAARASAESARMKTYESSVASAEQNLRGRREAAMARVVPTAKEVMEFFLPKGAR